MPTPTTAMSTVNPNRASDMVAEISMSASLSSRSSARIISSTALLEPAVFPIAWAAALRVAWPDSAAFARTPASSREAPVLSRSRGVTIASAPSGPWPGRVAATDIRRVPFFAVVRVMLSPAVIPSPRRYCC